MKLRLPWKPRWMLIFLACCALATWQFKLNPMDLLIFIGVWLLFGYDHWKRVCPNCGSRQLRDLGQVHCNAPKIENHGWFSFYQCMSCGECLKARCPPTDCKLAPEWRRHFKLDESAGPTTKVLGQ